MENSTSETSRDTVESPLTNTSSPLSNPSESVIPSDPPQISVAATEHDLSSTASVPTTNDVLSFITPQKQSQATAVTATPSESSNGLFVSSFFIGLSVGTTQERIDLAMQINVSVAFEICDLFSQ
jgi:hypothetical protein